MLIELIDVFLDIVELKDFLKEQVNGKKGKTHFLDFNKTNGFFS